MDTTERQIIDDLFEKLRQVEMRIGPRDQEAEAHIRNQLARQSAAPYYMAQTIIMQEQALAAATAHIEKMERERETRSTGPGFLAGLFGGGGAPAAGRRPHAASGDQRATPTARPDQVAGPWQTGGPGFLGGAMQTAIGVAGGMMLVNALGGMFGANEGEAAEPGTADPQPDSSSEEVDFGPEDADFGTFDDF